MKGTMTIIENGKKRHPAHEPDHVEFLTDTQLGYAIIEYRAAYAEDPTLPAPPAEAA